MKKLFTFLICCLTFLVGCEKKKINHMTPKEIVNLYFESKSNGDIDTLREIIDFSSGLPEDEKEKELKALLMGHEAKGMAKLFGVKFIVEYEKIIDETLAEVGVVFKGRNIDRKPFDQMELVKKAGVWKIKNSIITLMTEELLDRLKKNPKDSSAYYHLGMNIMSDNPAKANRLFKKYYNLEPHGFWISKEFLNGLKEFENTSKFEKDLLSSLYNIPQDSSDRAVVYRTVGQLYMELGDYKKTKMYFDKAEKSLRLDPDPLGKKRLKNSQQELELRLEGKYVDLLTELEKRNN